MLHQRSADGRDRANEPSNGWPLHLQSVESAEQPRERLLKLGARALCDKELLAILLGTGTRGEPVLSMAGRLLSENGGLGGLRTADIRSVTRKGLGPAKASRVLAAIELATRMAFSELPQKLSLDRPDASARYLLLRYGRRDQEVMGAVYLTARNQPIHEGEIYRGTLRRASVEPRTILREALSVGAAGVLLFHTHPSGNPAPSAEDLAFTQRFQQAAEVVGIGLVDHLILGETNSWTSLRKTGAIA